MGMASNQLVGQTVDDVTDAKGARFAGEFRVEQHLKQHIS